MNSKSLGSKKEHPLVRKEEAPDIEVFLYLSCLLFSPICSSGRLQQHEEPLLGVRRELARCVCFTCPAVFKASLFAVAPHLFWPMPSYMHPFGKHRFAALSGCRCRQRVSPANRRVNVWCRWWGNDRGTVLSSALSEAQGQCSLYLSLPRNF